MSSGSSTPGQSVSSIGGPLSPGLDEPGSENTPDTKPKSPKEEEEDAIRELAISNGLNHNKLLNGETCNSDFLEMFFSGYPRIVGMHLFPCLTTLVLMSQTIEKIEGLKTLTKLTELWISECELKKIENLGSCKLLRKLFLYGNQISKIENLDHLSDLEVLWLNNNQIQYLENLTTLSNLKVLNVADNKIDKIGHTLDANGKLEELNLSGNNIASLRDLTHLMRIPLLKNLSLKDPEYSPAPVSLLCNYSTHVLFHLPHLTKLDTYDVSKAVSDMAETTVVKKKMYYNMREKTVKRNMADILSKMEIYTQRLKAFPLERIKHLMCTMKEMYCEKEELREMNRSDLSEEEMSELFMREAESQAKLQKLDSTDEYSLKLNALRDRIKKWERKCAEFDGYHQEAVSHVKNNGDRLMKRMVLELESGGNVRFEEGSTNDIWFSSCHDLVLSRFCAIDYKDHGIAGIKIHKIIRVHNRMLRARFDEKLYSIVDDADGEYYPGNRNTAYKKLLEYLFWMWDPQLPGGGQEPTRVLEEGFLDADSYQGLSKDGAVPLSNSLSLADRHRMNYITRHNKNKENIDSCPFKYGQIVISKVYLGKSVKAIDDRSITRNAYPKIDSVFKPKKMCSLNGTTDGQGCECSSRQCEWYIFDHELVLPEYVVEFEYVTKLKSKSLYSHFSDMLLDNQECKVPTVSRAEEDVTVDDDVINMQPQSKARPRLIALTDELILKTANAESLERISVLNLHGNGLTKLKPLQSLTHLKRLTVSFNDLSKLDELSYSNLEYLDASFNKIVTLDGFKNVHHLKFLDLSWNQLQHTRDELSMMRKYTPNLVTLDIRHNSFQKSENLRLRVIGRLKSLTLLDGSAVTEMEATSALRVAAGSRISQLSLLSHARTNPEKARSLSLMPTPQILEKLSRNKPEKIGDHDTQWFLKVTSLNLDGQHITKISGLEKLENLKWASFNNNDLTKIEGLEHCVKLEELCLENNCISKVEGISKLTMLRKLSLGYNYITNLENCGLHYLVYLHYLSIENNEINSLAGLQKANSIVELYVGNNAISNVREIFNLKVLSNLVILDLFGNPVCFDTDNYRLFIIYHLKNLKALDGSAIEASEGNMAKDTFGGRLTPDFVAEKLGHSTFHDVRELDLPNCAVRIVDLGMGDAFINLRSVNLEHNNMTSFSGLVYLPNLRVLCLNHNHIECILPKSKPPRKPVVNASTIRSMDFYQSSDNMSPVLENLEVLHLGYNGIKDIPTLQLSRLTSLKALFLQGNEIQKVEGLDGLHDLRELVLDRNRIKNVTELSFANQWNLQELHMEENRIRDLANISCLDHLQRLYLGSNRIQEIAELDRVEGLNSLLEISLVNNPVARRHVHRPVLVFKLKQLMVIDGIPVTDEERAKAELYFMDQQVAANVSFTAADFHVSSGVAGQYLSNQNNRWSNVISRLRISKDIVPNMPYIPSSAREPIINNQGSVVDGSLPGIGQYKAQIPVKVTTMHLGTTPVWNGGVVYDETAQELQRGGGRRRGTKENGGTGLNRANTMVYNNMQGQAYTGLSYSTNTGNRPQFYLNQIPYVNPPSQTEYVEWFSRINQAKNNRR